MSRGRQRAPGEGTESEMNYRINTVNAQDYDGVFVLSPGEHSLLLAYIDDQSQQEIIDFNDKYSFEETEDAPTSDDSDWDYAEFFGIRKYEGFTNDMQIAFRSMDNEDENDLNMDANDAAARVYEAFFAAHPEIKELPQFEIDEYGISGFAPAVDAAMKVFADAANN